MGESVRSAVCNTCGVTFDYTGRARKVPSYCRACFRDYDRKWRADRTKEDPLFNVRKNSWEKHGLYPEELVAWQDELGGCCQLCGVEFSRDDRGRMPCVDHTHGICAHAENRSCHSCRRSLICFNCNTVLGKVGDNTETLRRMVNYLERYLEGVHE